jgi:hypothetical protein
MISSLQIFVITATEPVAHPVATRTAMPIDCRNIDSQAGQQLILTCFSCSVPNKRGLPRQTCASQQLRGHSHSSLTNTLWQLSP